jgi:hypothetical protein
LIFANAIIHTQETDNNFNADEYYWYDFETAEGITIYAERPKEFDSESPETYILNQLNGSLLDRKNLIETDFLDKAGFSRTGNVKYRKSAASEKVSSVLHGIGHAISLGIIPQRPFLEIEYDKLPKGKCYDFSAIIVKSEYKDISPDVLIILELEYKLQIEFCNGIVIQDNLSYYTDENIRKFESLILRLPDYPESVYQAKNRYMNELEKIKTAYNRHKNPSENNLKAMQNLRDFSNVEIR